MRDRYKIIEQDEIYFITSTIVEWLPVFTSDEYFEILINSVKYCAGQKSLKIYAYVILDNHFHLIASAPELTKVISSLKKYSAKLIIKQLKQDNKDWLLNQLAYRKKAYKKASTYQVWQEGIHPVLISNLEIFRQKVEYIHFNPVKRGLVDMTDHWRYSSARNYIHEDHSIIEVDCSMS